ELLVLRFLAGLGLGGAAPSFLAMGAEYAPRRLRSITVAALYSAFPLGAAIGGFVGAYTIPHFGWRSMFVIGGVGPLLIAALIAVWLPESLRFLVAKGVRKDTIKRILLKIAPRTDFTDAEIVGGELVIPQAKSRLASVFQDGRAPTTLILWVPFFTGFMVILTVTTWTPSLLKAASVPISMGVLILAANNLGGVVGAVVGGHLLKKYGPHLVLAPAMIVGGISLAVFGQVTHSIPALMITSIVNGLLVGGSISMLLSLAAAVYPTMIRSTGIGWAMGVGRFGQILGPIALGLLVARHIPISGLFIAMGIPCVIGGLAILGLIPLLGRLDFGAASAPTIDQIATAAPEI
ncbi:MFS transporter, partial [Caulobacter sp. S45]|uniref:MFS transporter n=1 Tax=Caulobacter sp. S45 TaxID=1641861 RepID=UPI00131EB64B